MFRFPGGKTQVQRFVGGSLSRQTGLLLGQKQKTLIGQNLKNQATLISQNLQNQTKWQLAAQRMFSDVPKEGTVHGGNPGGGTGPQPPPTKGGVAMGGEVFSTTKTVSQYIRSKSGSQNLYPKPRPGNPQQEGMAQGGERTSASSVEGIDNLSDAARYNKDTMYIKLPTEGNDRWYVLASLFFAHFCLQKLFGQGHDTFDQKFRVYEKDPYALESFYEAHDLLDVMGLHPFFVQIIMGRVSWWDESEFTGENENKKILKGNEDGHLSVKHIGMEIAFELVEEETEDENGETTVGKYTRTERFILYPPMFQELGISRFFYPVLCDHTWTFGFEREEDGTCVCRHRCTDYNGYWFFRLPMWIHMWYVTSACETFLNSPKFGDDDYSDECHEELAFLLPHIYGDLVDKILGRKKAVLRQKKAAGKMSKEEQEEAEEEIQQLERLKTNITKTDAAALEAEDTVVLRKSTIRQIKKEVDSNENDAFGRQSAVLIQRDGTAGQKAMKDTSDEGHTKVQVVTQKGDAEQQPGERKGDMTTSEVLAAVLREAKKDPAIFKAVTEAMNHKDLIWTEPEKQSVGRSVSVKPRAAKVIANE